MKTLKEIIGAEPIYHPDIDAYTPSKASLALMAPDKTNYKEKDYPNADTSGKKKVLVLSVDQGILVCENGKRFKTGDHPVEMFLVLMHLEKAGFHPVFATLTGEKVQFEDWAFPSKDDAVIAFKAKHQKQLDNPFQISEIIKKLNVDEYEAVFVPGGQGAILGLPESKEVKSAFQWFMKNDKHLIVICHGPASLISLSIDEKDDDFPLKDYSLACLPSSGDNMGVKVGYLPGKMP
ncbi:MAG: DJ-1/PfpI family protein [Saprospiraceae bacterium]|nr:DJ-1/PfpI family protein [Saprospiraceae bacterium]